MSERALPLFALKDPAGILETPPDYIEMLPIAIYACDAKGRVRWFNARAAELGDGGLASKTIPSCFAVHSICLGWTAS